MNFNLITNAKAKIFFLFFCLISVQTFAYAQNNATITLRNKSISVIDALREIEKQSKLSIAFNESQLAGKKAANLDVKNGSVEEALTGVLRGSGFTYRVSSRVTVASMYWSRSGKTVRMTVADDLVMIPARMSCSLR